MDLYSVLEGPSPLITSLRGNFFFQFVSNSSGNGNGFAISYQTYNPILTGRCSSGVEKTMISGIAGTFGCIFSYNASIIREWKVVAPSSSLFYFTYLQISSGTDFIEIYYLYPDNSTVFHSNVSGAEIPPAFVGISFLFRFKPNSTANGGFKIAFEPLTQASYQACGSSLLSHDLGEQGDFGCETYSNSVVVKWISEASMTRYSLFQNNFQVTNCCDEMRVSQINPAGGESLIQVFDGITSFYQYKGANLSI